MRRSRACRRGDPRRSRRRAHRRSAQRPRADRCRLSWSASGSSSTSVTSSTAKPARVPPRSATSIRCGASLRGSPSTAARSKTGSRSPRRLQTPSVAREAPGATVSVADLADLEHVRHRERVQLRADAHLDVDVAHAARKSTAEASSGAPASAPPRVCSQLRDQLLERSGGAVALGLVGGELAGSLADLDHRLGHLVGSRALLLGRQDRLLQHRGRAAHQLTDLTRLTRTLLGRHDRRVGLVLNAADDLRGSSPST